MSGKIAPQILTLNYFVYPGFELYTNVSFPGRTKISKIWFTADPNLAGTFENERVARLGAVKSRNARYEGGAPSDWAPFFAGDGDPSLKPAIWFGNPNERPEGMVIQGNAVSTAYRSTIGLPAPASTKNAIHETMSAEDLINDSQNSYWTNLAWDPGETLAKRYKGDQSILNSDEILSLFVYQDGGDWNDFTEAAFATIFIEYTDASGDEDSYPVREWPIG